MKIKTSEEISVSVPLVDLMALAYRARQADILYHEKIAREAKINRIRGELTKCQSALERKNAEMKVLSDTIDRMKRNGWRADGGNEND